MERRLARGLERVSLKTITLATLVCLLPASAAIGQEDMDLNNPGVWEPVSSTVFGQEIRVPNTDQSTDGDRQSTITGDIVIEEATSSTSLLGHPITHVASPNDDMRWALRDMVVAARGNNATDLKAAAQEMLDILLGTTQGRIYDGFGMLNFNRWKDDRLDASHFPGDAVPGEYKMKDATATGETYTSPWDGEERKIWEIDVNMLYYDGQIDSDTFLAKFPAEAHPDDTLRVHYRIYSLVIEDFSPTMVMLDRRLALNTVQFPFKGMDHVWIGMNPGDVLNVTTNYPPIRMLRGVYTWGWREHPPRIQFLQPVYEIVNARTGEVELDPQSKSYICRNREDLTLENIGSAAPEMKMYEVAMAALNGTPPLVINRWLSRGDFGPRGTWIDWADLAKNQKQIPPEAWDLLAERGISPTDFDGNVMLTAFVNNELYGEGPFQNEVVAWNQGDVFRIQLINLDNHRHYFRNVDFGPRLNDDILQCCGGGETSFEVMNFKGTYGVPKVAEMQWRAGWGFRPHYDIVQQPQLFSRGSDRAKLKPYTGGEGGTFFGYQFQNRVGDFRFNPPDFIIGVSPVNPNPSTFRLKDLDGEEGLIIGQETEGFGIAKMCPDAPYPGFCTQDISAYNPNGVLNFDTDGDGVNDELRFPPFIRNSDQTNPNAGDIIPPTGAWRAFLWINPNNGTLFIDPDDKSKGYWADLTYSHGAPVEPNSVLSANVELPRASGQVFYQFDDLFHDNAIFSPHPLSQGEDKIDSVEQLNAFTNGFVRIRGTFSSLPSGVRAEWATLHLGGAGDDGCEGEVLSTAPIDEAGFFVFRCNQSKCSAPLNKAAPSANGKICVQSSIGGYAETTVQP